MLGAKRKYLRLVIAIFVITFATQIPAMARADSRVSEAIAQSKTSEPREIVRVTSSLLEKKSLSVSEKIEAYKFRANAYLALRRDLSAMTDLQAALNLAPKDKELLLAAGNLALKLRRNSAALGYFNSLRKADPSVVIAHVNAMRLHMSANQFQKALDANSDVLGLLPDSPPILGIRGILLNKLGRYQDAVRVLSPLIADYPRTANYLKSRSEAFIGLRDGQRALEDLEKALDILQAPLEKAKIFHAMVEAHRILGDFDSAHASLSRTIEIDGLRPFHSMNRARLYFEERKFEAALRSVDTAIAALPTQFAYYIFRSQINGAMGREADALSDIDKFANRIGPVEHYYRAKTFEALGRLDDAIDEYATYLSKAKDQKNPAAKMARERIEALRAKQ